MQAPPPQPARLHWIPFPPSWIVSAGLVLLGVLPHQVPKPIRRFIQSTLGALLIAGLAIVITRRAPVLGVALLIFAAGVYMSTPTPVGIESFAAPILNKDRVQHRRRWLSEEVLSEEPAAIQERTDNPALQLDEISGDEHQQWYDEDVLDVHPTAIQDRPVPMHQYDYDDTPSSAGISRG